MKKKLLVFSALIIAAILVTAIAVSGSRRSKYNSAIDLGQKYLTEMKYEEAIAAFQEALGIDVSSDEAVAGLKESYIGKGKSAAKTDWQTSLECIKKLVEIDDSEAFKEELANESLSWVGEIHSYNEAEYCYSKAMEIDTLLSSETTIKVLDYYDSRPLADLDDARKQAKSIEKLLIAYPEQDNIFNAYILWMDRFHKEATKKRDSFNLVSELYDFSTQLAEIWEERCKWMDENLPASKQKQVENRIEEINQFVRQTQELYEAKVDQQREEQLQEQLEAFEKGSIEWYERETIKETLAAQVNVSISNPAYDFYDIKHEYYVREEAGKDIEEWIVEHTGEIDKGNTFTDETYFAVDRQNKTIQEIYVKHYENWVGSGRGSLVSEEESEGSVISYREALNNADYSEEISLVRDAFTEVFDDLTESKLHKEYIPLRLQGVSKDTGEFNGNHIWRVACGIGGHYYEFNVALSSDRTKMQSKCMVGGPMVSEGDIFRSTFGEKVETTFNFRLLKDQAETLTGDELTSVSKELQQLVEEAGMDILLLTLPNLGGYLDPGFLASDYFYSYVSVSADGLIFLYGVQEKKLTIKSFGKGKEIINETACDELTNEISPILESGNYPDAFKEFIKMVSDKL